MKLFLVCNYAPDRQQSMLRFGELLREQWTARGWDVSCIAPESSGLAAKLSRCGAGKWSGYLDKYVLFPSRLKRSLHAEAFRKGAGRALVHVVDHSNAVYVPRSRTVPWVVTCHDLLAVRGALGEDTDCPASAMGRQLQRAIVRGLSRADAVVADSSSTLGDVDRLVPVNHAQARRVVLLGLNHPYRRLETTEAKRRLPPGAGVPWGSPFLLHVGSNLPRKNKAGVLRVFARIAQRWPGNLVFCGAELTAELRSQAEAAGIAQRVFSVSAPDNSMLEAVYNLAHALLYPSKCEGFGWPIIEAQACGCPVVCSDRTSLPEVGGAGALVHELGDEAGMGESILRLGEPGFRAAVVGRGLANLERFALSRMIDAYGEVYDEVLRGPRTGRSEMVRAVLSE